MQIAMAVYLGELGEVTVTCVAFRSSFCMDRDDMHDFLLYHTVLCSGCGSLQGCAGTLPPMYEASLPYVRSV